MKSEIDNLLRAHVLIPDRREPWEWAGGTKPDRSDAAINFGNTTSFRGVYDIANVPWVKEFLRACNDRNVREINFCAPPQDSGKTKGAETYLAFRVVTKPGNSAFNTSTNVKAEQWSETRWEPMLESVKGIKAKFSANIHHKKKRRIIFKDGTFLLIQGAEVEANRASDSVETQINDEVYLWDRPQMKEMIERTNAYRDTRKVINISVGGKKNTEWHEHFLSGNQGEWHHLCPKCSKPFDYVFDNEDPRCNIRFDLTRALLHADGRLDLREFAKTIFINCQSCGHAMQYDRARLAELNRTGIYISRNPDADPTIVSLHVNAFALGREPWVEILEPWVRLHMRGGVFSPKVLKEFVTKKLAEFWDEKPFAVSKELKLAGWNRADVLPPGSWKDEAFRIMAGDNQRGAKGDIPHKWFAGIAFSRDGRMRIFDAGRVNEWDGLREKQIQLGVPDATPDKPGPWVVIDRRYDPIQVDERCSLYKWHGTMGADRDSFLHPDWSPFAKTRQLFSEDRSIDIGYGTAQTGRTFAVYFFWATQAIQDLLGELRNAGKIEFAADSARFCPELAVHMNAHRQIISRDKKNGNEKRTWVRIGDTPDHLYDVVCQGVVVGCMAGIYAMPENKNQNTNP